MSSRFRKAKYSAQPESRFPAFAIWQSAIFMLHPLPSLLFFHKLFLSVCLRPPPDTVLVLMQNFLISVFISINPNHCRILV